MRIETGTHWIVLGTDGRHVSIGRTEPSEEGGPAASNALTTQGLSRWLARMQGDYYSQGNISVEPLQRVGIPYDADWQAVLAAFHPARRRSISTGTQQQGPHFGTYSRIYHANHVPKSRGTVIR